MHNDTHLNLSLTTSTASIIVDKKFHGESLDAGEVSHDELDEAGNWTLAPIEWHQVDLLHYPAVRIVVVVIYIIIITVGLVGNGGVLLVFARSKRLQTVTNVFIMNLALADVWLAAFSLPVQLHYQLTNRWIFGSVLCRIVFAAFAVPMYVSTISILLIAVDRYRQILFPLRPRLSARWAVSLIAMTILLSIVISLPVMHYSRLYEHVDRQLGIHWSYCVEIWPESSLTIRRAYSIIAFSVQFLLPLSVTGYLYAGIYARLKLRPPGLQKRAKKTNRLLIAIVANFFICWLPFNIFSLLTELNPDSVGGSNFRLVDLLLKAFALGSSCVNPFLYSWLNDNFRNEFNTLAIQLKIYQGGGIGSGSVGSRSGVWLGRPHRHGGQIRGRLDPYTRTDFNTAVFADGTDSYLLEDTIRSAVPE